MSKKVESKSKGTAKKVNNNTDKKVVNKTVEKSVNNTKQEKKVEQEIKQKSESSVSKKRYTTHQFAQMFYVTTTTVIAWIKNGTIKKVVKTAGGHRRIPQSEADRLKKELGYND